MWQIQQGWHPVFTYPEDISRNRSKQDSRQIYNRKVEEKRKENAAKKGGIKHRNR